MYIIHMYNIYYINVHRCIYYLQCFAQSVSLGLTLMSMYITRDPFGPLASTEKI